MPRCYMVKKIPRHYASSPCSPTEASIAPPCQSPSQHPSVKENRPPSANSSEYEEIGCTPISERSAAETEAAHDLLSLAHSLPPLPPANNMVAVLPPEPAPNNVVAVLPPEPSILPIYTYTIQPTNIFIITEEPPEPIFHTMPAIAPMPHFEYTLEPQVSYLAYQPPYQPIPDITLPDMPIIPILVPAADIIPEPTQCLAIEPEPAVVKTLPAIKEKPTKYDCNECGKCYATSSNLSRHKQTHRSLDSVEAKRCEDCGKVYVSMPALAMHVLTHRMGHVCGVCGKLFSRPWLLRGHIRSHTGEKPYDCPYDGCTRAFADRSNLRAHLQTHSGDKKFECSKCHKTFALKSYLAKHEETVCYRDEIMCDPEFMPPVPNYMRNNNKKCNKSMPECFRQEQERFQPEPEIIQRLPDAITYESENIPMESDCNQSGPAIIRFKTACARFDVECTQFETECLKPEPAIIRFKPSSKQPETESPESPDSMAYEPVDIKPQPAVIHFDPSCALPKTKIIRYDQIVLPDLD